jgi:hypothetical protein
MRGYLSSSSPTYTALNAGPNRPAGRAPVRQCLGLATHTVAWQMRARSGRHETHCMPYGLPEETRPTVADNSRRGEPSPHVFTPVRTCNEGLTARRPGRQHEDP